MTPETALSLIANPEVRMYSETPIVKTLLLMMCHSPMIGEYYGLQHFVLEHGKYFINEQRDVQYGPKQHCYHTSQNDIVMDSELLYVEGYVQALGVPISHGWNITRDGEVIDRTLREPNCEYWGIVFTRDYVISEMIRRNATIAHLGNWQEDFPLLRDEELQTEAFHYEWTPDLELPRRNPMTFGNRWRWGYNSLF